MNDTRPREKGKKRVRRELGEQDIGKPAWKQAGRRQGGKKLARQGQEKASQHEAGSQEAAGEAGR